MNATVLKFGGSTFLNPEDYGRVARHIADRVSAGEKKIVAVVSAMSGTTGNLKAIMLDVNKQASASNLDAALATGEMLSACLLEAAVSRLNVPAVSLNGYSLGIHTNSDFGRASVETVDPKPIISAFQDHDVVIAAGGQAIDQSGKLTFLGRNSSDLSAVVIASMLGERSCEIYSDVPGVYTADPNLIPEAKLIPEIAYGTIAQMSRHGAKVMHHRAVDYAGKHAVAIVCKSLTGDRAVTGTIIADRGNASSVTVARDASLLSCASLAERDKLRVLLDQHDINAICVEDTYGYGICILNDIDFAMRLVALTGTCSAPVESKPIVTEIDSSRLLVHVERDYEHAISLARQIHTRMYPVGVNEPIGWRMAKQRSAYSSLLTRANDPPVSSK